MKLYTGLDIHKKTIYGTMVDESGKIIDQRNFENNEETLKEFLCGRPTKIVIEACGFWMDIYDKLTTIGYEVILAHPLKVQAIASAKMKSDKIDSEILAHLLRGDLIPEAWPPSKEVREQRDLVRFRSNLVRTRTMMKNRIKAVLLKQGIKTDRGLWKGRKRQELESLQNVKISAYLRIMDKVEEEIKHVDKKVTEINKKDYQAQLLTSIYGVSDYAARMILSEIGDINRFSSAKKLKSYSGLTPRMYQSGQRCRQAGITRQGSKWLRWILVQCVHVAVRKKESPLGRFYHRLVQHKKKQIATVATACKLLEIIYAMLRDCKPYKT